MKKILFLILIGSLWYVAAMYSSPALLSLSMTATALMAFLFLLPRIQNYGFSTIFPLATRTMTKGTQEQLRLQNKKKSLLPIARCRYDLLTRYEGEKKPVKQKYVSGCSNKADLLDLPFTPRYSGMLTIQLHKTRIYDPLGIFSSGKKQGSSIKVAVLPQIRVDQKGFSRSVDQNDKQPGEQPNRGAGTEGDLRQIRTWLPGDRPSRIHWNLTARLQETMVREWNEESVRVRTLQLKKDAKEYAAADADRFYEAFANEVQSILLEGSEVKVSWKNKSGVMEDRMIRETADLEDLLLHLMDSSWLWEGRR